MCSSSSIDTFLYAVRKQLSVVETQQNASKDLVVAITGCDSHGHGSYLHHRRNRTRTACCGLAEGMDRGGRARPSPSWSMCLTMRSSVSSFTTLPWALSPAASSKTEIEPSWSTSIYG